MKTIEIRTLADEAYERVRAGILAGGLVGGDPIRQDAIAAELGISKIPLREALTRLERDGLVSSQRNRGFAVSALSAAEAEEVFALRLKLEPAAALGGSRNATAADHDAARAAFRRLANDTRVASVEQGTSNRLFHMTLVAPGAGRITLSMIERLNVVAERYVRLHLAPAGRESRAGSEHRDILAAWVRGDLARVERLMSSHLQDTLDDLRHQLRHPPG